MSKVREQKAIINQLIKEIEMKMKVIIVTIEETDQNIQNFINCIIFLHKKIANFSFSIVHSFCFIVYTNFDKYLLVKNFNQLKYFSIAGLYFKADRERSKHYEKIQIDTDAFCTCYFNYTFSLWL